MLQAQSRETERGVNAQLCRGHMGAFILVGRAESAVCVFVSTFREAPRTQVGRAVFSSFLWPLTSQEKWFRIRGDL